MEGKNFFLRKMFLCVVKGTEGTTWRGAYEKTRRNQEEGPALDRILGCSAVVTGKEEWVGTVLKMWWERVEVLPLASVFPVQ